MTDPKPDLSTPAARLYFARTLRGAGMKSLSTAAGLSSGAVQFIEANPASDPGVGTVRKIAEQLDCHPAWIAYGTGPMAPPGARARRGGAVVSALPYVEHWTLAVDVTGQRVEHPIAVELDEGVWEATSPVDDRANGIGTTRESDDGAALAVAELVGRLLRRGWAKGWRVLSIARTDACALPSPAPASATAAGGGR